MRKWNESGDASTEVVLVAPVLILLIFTILQFGLWYHASSVVRSAAQEGVRVSRVAGGTEQAARMTAESFIDQSAGLLVQSPVVEATRSQDVTSVRIHGITVGIVPGLRLGVTGFASSPTEVFRSPT
jgi:Flp pilus assembly protein TadG